MRFSVCITTVRAGVLGHAIRSIAGQTLTDWELIVVGQGPDEAALRAATEEAAPGDPRERYLHLEAKGRSRALNAGMRASGGEIIANTDDDCEADPHWLEELDARLRAEPGTGAVGGALVAPSGPWHAWSFCPAVTPPRKSSTIPSFPVGRRPQAGIGSAPTSPFAARSRSVSAPSMSAWARERRSLRPRTSTTSCGWRRWGSASAPHPPRSCITATGGARACAPAWPTRGRTAWATVDSRASSRCKAIPGAGNTSGASANACAKSRRHPLRYPFRWRNLRTFEGAYRRCLEEYTLDSSGIRLVPRHATAPRSDAPRIPQAVERGDGR